MIGTSIGTYRITAKLGAGGMGEVYRAHDTKLKRDVALKVLPDAFARDPERLARFEREAEVLASLNHPNIAAIYGVVEDRALVMELVEGVEPKGPLPFDEAWAIMSQVAAALEYAHEKGVVHRDLKPANIKVTPESTVKLLDFGLAKAFSNQPEKAANPENSPTLTMGATQAGVILGTAAYMSPEQAKGKQVNKRADIWAFGVVLFELLTGERLFKGEDISETLAQVLTKEPELEKVPAKARRLLQACLEKDPKQRLRDIGDAKRLIGEEAPVGAKTRSPWPWAVTALFALVAVALGFIAYRHVNEEQPSVIRLSIPLPQNGSFDSFNGYVVSVSPDGKRVAYLADVDKSQIWVHDLSSLVSRPIEGTEDAIGSPFWSPDSKSVGFFAGGKLKKIDVTGGPPQTICDASPGRSGTWNQDNAIVFQPGSTDVLYRVSASGGDAVPVTKLGPSENAHRFPSFLPDGHHFLYTAISTAEPEKGGIYVGDLSGSASVRVISGNTNGVYVRPGYLLFVRQGTIMALPFDADRLRVSGEAVPVATQVDFNAAQARGQFSASPNGVLAYSPGRSEQHPIRDYEYSIATDVV